MLYSFTWEWSMLMSVLDPNKPVPFPSVISHALTLGNGDCVSVSLARIPEPKRWAVWVWALWGRILGVMANTILFANSTDYCSSGCQGPNKQIIPKTNASTHSCPSRAEHAAVWSIECVCARIGLYMRLRESTWNERTLTRMDYELQEHSVRLDASHATLSLPPAQSTFLFWVNRVFMRTMAHKEVVAKTINVLNQDRMHMRTWWDN